MQKETRKLCWAVVAGTLCLLCCLTGCQPPPVEEEQVRADFSVAREEISIGNAAHTLELSAFTIVNRSTEDNTEIVSCEYTLSDGVYEMSGEYALSYQYDQGNWRCFDMRQTVEATLTTTAETPPEELLARFEEWEEDFSSSETVTRTSEIEKISDTQFQTRYTVSESGDYWQASTEYIVQGELNPLVSMGGTDIFLWDIKEGEEASTEKWDIVGEYLKETDSRKIYLKIDSFDAETLTAHVAYGEYIWYAYFPGDEDSVKTVSDIMVQFDSPEEQFGVPKYISAYFSPFSIRVYKDGFQEAEGFLEKIA